MIQIIVNSNNDSMGNMLTEKLINFLLFKLFSVFYISLLKCTFVIKGKK